MTNVADILKNATCKPSVKLVGSDGNAFAILGRCRVAAQNAKWTDDEINTFVTEATSGDYDHLLVTVCSYFDVSLDDDEDNEIVFEDD